MYTVGGGLLSQSDFLFKVNELLDESWIVRDNKKVEYYNVPAGFDIETSSFYQGEKKSENKRSIMYIWQFGIYNYVTKGRTWSELVNLLKVLEKILTLNPNRRLVVYVHNLPYEFQFIRKRLEWDEVFILSERKPVYATSNGIEFRCSLKLAGGKSLANMAKDLQKYKVEKAVDNLNYELIRTPLTPLTDKELLYCENDIRVILCYIQEKIEQDGDITRIPLTNTGYVRNYCRKECYSRWKTYRRIMENLTLDSAEYSQLKRAFQGGFTHANAHYVGQILEQIGSHDFTSSYPAVMVLEKFPMGKSTMITDGINEKELRELLLTYCCMFDIEIFGLMPKLFQEHPISRYKCWICENAIVDNGRIVMAEHIATTITEQDFFVYSEFYTWESIEIKNLRVYQKNYLPKKFVQSILGLYEKKTVLKDVEGEEINYMISKNMINAGYGMMVTDPIRDELVYRDNIFYTIPKNVQEGIERYNNNIRRFLFYPWGVWVTAYARANLFSGIIEMGSDYVYSDTDSIKSMNTQEHLQYFDSYNAQILKKIEIASEYHKIDKSLFAPYTQKGKQKIIGVWDDEGVYDRFKTLGAKRYLTMKLSTRTISDDGLTVQLTEPKHMITLAGSNKTKTMQYLRKTLSPFENFSDGLTIPPDASGRLILTYIDDETEGDIIDMNGIQYHYHELSSVHMEKSEYNLSMSEEFIRYLEGLQDFGE